ncbi:MAG: hypothetical protein PVF47_12670 [Anaerolineae bacterium]
MSDSWTPLVALAATLLPLLWVKRWITYSLQELSARWVGDADVALVVYFVFVLPGVVVHELSHWLMAKVLGVRVSKLSIGPVRKKRGSSVSLGSVRVGKVDPLRASLIGLAPLLGATAIILIIGNLVLGVDDLARAVAGGGFEQIRAALAQLVRVPDFWLWLYFIFAISNAMLPSESDMSTVRPVLIFLGLATAVYLIVAGVPSVSPQALAAVNTIAGYLASAFGLTLAVDIFFALIIALLLAITRRAQGW